MNASLKIDIWTKGSERLPPHDELPEAIAPHVEHVARMCTQGYQSGQITDDKFSGWWSIT